MNFSQGIQPPKSRIVTWQSSFLDTKSSHDRIIEDHYFNSRIEVFIPYTKTSKNTAKELTKMIKQTNSNFFYFIDSPVASLVEECRKLFQQGNRIYATSVCTRIDSGNVMSILPNGFLPIFVKIDVKV